MGSAPGIVDVANKFSVAQEMVGLHSDFSATYFDLAVMKRSALWSYVIAITALAIGCASKALNHVGVWELQDQDLHINVSLNTDGTCILFFAANRAEGFIGDCTYSLSGLDILLTHITNNPGTGKKTDDPMRMRYESVSDSILMDLGKELRLIRASKAGAK
jgi:hypothetical protein